MAKLDLMIPVAQKIELNIIHNEPREYLGYSGLGHPCKRKVWYDFYWASEDSYSSRIQRLFNRGKAEENIIIADLESVGCTISKREYEIIDDTGHVKGHIDGEVSNVPGLSTKAYLLEMKTMNDKYFKNYSNVGLKLFNETYWQQIHSYMGKMKYDGCLYVVTNKNDETRDYKKIPFDKNQYDIGERIAFSIITAEFPPERLGGKTFHICKMCKHYDVCHKGKTPIVSCRTCANVDILPKGKWRCQLDSSKKLTKNKQIHTCGEAYSLSGSFK